MSFSLYGHNGNLQPLQALRLYGHHLGTSTVHKSVCGCRKRGAWVVSKCSSYILLRGRGVTRAIGPTFKCLWTERGFVSFTFAVANRSEKRIYVTAEVLFLYLFICQCREAVEETKIRDGWKDRNTDTSSYFHLPNEVFRVFHVLFFFFLFDCSSELHSCTRRPRYYCKSFWKKSEKTTYFPRLRL